MFGIIGGLLGGWILGLFGFKAVVIEGMSQVFGVTLNVLGYYFLFGLMGATKSVVSYFSFRKKSENSNGTKFDLNELLKNKKNK